MAISIKVCTGTSVKTICFYYRATQQIKIFFTLNNTPRIKPHKLSDLQSQQSTGSQSDSTSSELLVSTSLEGRDVSLGQWAVSHLWTARGDGNQSGRKVSLGGDVESGHGGGGSGDDSDGRELHC